LEVIIISQPFPEMTVRKAILHIFFCLGYHPKIIGKFPAIEEESLVLPYWQAGRLKHRCLSAESLFVECCCCCRLCISFHHSHGS
jgi:hypothetical protein